MKQYVYLFCLGIFFVACEQSKKQDNYYSVEELRQLYSSGNTANWPPPTLDSNIIGFKELGVLPGVTFPEGNPYSEAKRALGKMLFYDPRLSGSEQIACASCHDPNLGWADGKRVPFGHDRTPGVRNTISIINIAYAKNFFWDGRAESMEAQAKSAIENPIEMNNHMALVVDSIQNIKGYRPYFEKAYGNPEITEKKILNAIVTFERTIVSRKSDFDRFISGDSTRLTNQEVLGLHLFRTKARCINCHNSPYFSDQQFHNVGLSYYGRKYEDLGVYKLTKKAEDVGKFKTAPLREIAHTAPYMHNGLFPHLEGVINMYNAGMPHVKPKGEQVNDSLFPSTSPLLKELNLTEKEQEALEAFLESISSSIYREPLPEEFPK